MLYINFDYFGKSKPNSHAIFRLVQICDFSLKLTFCHDFYKVKEDKNGINIIVKNIMKNIKNIIKFIVNKIKNIKMKNREYYKNNKDKIAKQNKKYRETNNEKK